VKNNNNNRCTKDGLKHFIVFICIINQFVLVMVKQRVFLEVKNSTKYRTVIQTRTGWCTDKAVDMYFEVSCFESRTGHRYSD
jgi:hypothetical protein